MDFQNGVNHLIINAENVSKRLAYFGIDPNPLIFAANILYLKSHMI